LSSGNTSTSTSSFAHIEKDDLDEDGSFGPDFARQLAEGMEELVTEIGGGEEMKKTMEALVGAFQPKKDSMMEFPSSSSSSSSATDKKDTKPDNNKSNFQDKVNETIHKLKTSSDKVEVKLLLFSSSPFVLYYVPFNMEINVN